ncbi:RNA polymerase sigma factor [Micromonospora gifhornensis]|uniref:RNA polymerase sigma factor n=1 Tax=Micromonospora gifhornensis TaxID=84594 RepID=UPI00366168DC
MQDLLRGLVPQVLSVLVRRHGDFEACEDAVQEALLAAVVQWPEQGMPDFPLAWLITVASRRLTDLRRSEAARHRREVNSAALTPRDEFVAAGPGDDLPHGDDTLVLLLLCCHPALSRPAQMALTLRAVGGLTTAQIANAFMVPDATMSQRISRAKRQIKAAGATFQMPSGADLHERLQVVRHVLYLIFNEGYTATSGPDLRRPDLTREAIRLTREIHRLLPDDGEVAGLLALMLLTDARSPARTGPDGALIALADQDRSKWNQDQIAEGVGLVTRTLSNAPIGPYQLQAAIAALHDEAERAEDTDWPQILVLYDLLEQVWPNPVVRLNKVVAATMARGPRSGLELLATLDSDERIAGSHRLLAVRAHLLELAGDCRAALAAYKAAARRATNLPERRYLEARATRLHG